MSAAGTVAITMAGAGRRFVEAGYPRPKYEIIVGGRPLFDWSMMAVQSFLAAGWTAAFATRSELNSRPFLSERCAALDIAIAQVVELDAVTDGQATTALHLARLAPADRPFLVFNIDTFVAPGAMRPEDIAAGSAGWVPCFPGPGEGWSFARTDGSERIVELREKQRISPHATVGLYWFDSAARYLSLYDAFFSGGAGQEKGERYIAPMYNRLIEHGERVTMLSIAIDDVGMLGTPDQVDAFRADPPRGAVPYIIG